MTSGRTAVGSPDMEKPIDFIAPLSSVKKRIYFQSVNG